MLRGYTLKEKSKGENNKMVKKVKEMNPKQNIPGKCASLNATTISFFVINKIVCNLYFMPQFMNSQIV